MISAERKTQTDVKFQASGDRLQSKDDDDLEKLLVFGSRAPSNLISDMEEHHEKVRTNESDKFPKQHCNIVHLRT